MTETSIFKIMHSQECTRMREVLHAAGYDDRGLIDVLGPIQLPTRAGRELPHFLHLTKALRPVDVLIRLFLIGAPVDQALAAQVLRPMSLSDWVQAGLVETQDRQARGRLRLMPFRGMILACDYVDNVEPGGRLDQVMGLTASTVAIADFTVRRPVESTLDLGAGGGVQSLLASSHSRQVVGVDRSARAVEFARFNACLNGIANCEFLQGDAFESVPGRQFDLVVSNPPFAITPSRRYMYRDSGADLDSFCQRLAREAPQHLREGGLFQMGFEWAHLAGQDWNARLSGWFEGTGCDVWILRTDTHSAPDYARIWVRDTEHETEEASARLYEEWTSYYEAKGVEAVSTGLVVMRRAAGRRNWVRFEELPEGTSGPVGDSIELGLRLHDYLDTARGDEALLAARLCVSPPVRLEDV